MPAGASVIDSWNPQVVDYIYVNDTINRTIEYSITTDEPLAASSWNIDQISATGANNGSTYSYLHRWDNRSIGFHTILFKGNNSESNLEFRWYVNVYEIGGYRGGNLFDAIEDMLENHETDIKIRLFKNRIEKYGSGTDLVSQKASKLKEDVTNRQTAREFLLKEFKAGNITIEKYVSALKQVQRDAKYDMKQAKELAKISKDDLKDEKFSEDFEKISEMEDDHDWEHDFRHKKKEEAIENKGTGKNKDKEKGTEDHDEDKDDSSEHSD